MAQVQLLCRVLLFHLDDQKKELHLFLSGTGTCLLESGSSSVEAASTSLSLLGDVG